MKLVLALLLAAAAGVGGFRAAMAADPPAPDACPGDECDVSVECTDAGTCLITCVGADGRTCELEIACDGDECVVVRCARDGEPCADGTPCAGKVSCGSRR